MRHTHDSDRVPASGGTSQVREVQFLQLFLSPFLGEMRMAKAEYG